VETTKIVLDDNELPRIEKVIVFNWSGHGLMDLTGYDAYFQGKLHDHSLPQKDLDKGIEELKDLPRPEIRKTGKW